MTFQCEGCFIKEQEITSLKMLLGKERDEGGRVSRYLGIQVMTGAMLSMLWYKVGLSFWVFFLLIGIGWVINVLVDEE